MSPFTAILVCILTICVAFRSCSYAAWNWKHDNKMGSVMVILVSLISVFLPIYIIYFKT